MAVAFKQGDIPLDGDAEALILIGLDRKIGAEEDREFDVRLLRDAAQERA